MKGVSKTRNLTDRVPYTSWATSMEGDGAWLRFHFAGTRYVSGLRVLPGCAGSNRTFGEFSRPKQLLLEGRDRSVRVVVADRRKEQFIAVDPPLPADSLVVRVLTVHKGRASAVCFTEIAVHEQSALGAVDKKTRAKLETWSAALSGPDWKKAFDNLVALGPAAVPHLSLALGQRDLTVQGHALKALISIGAPSSADALLRYWTKGPDESVRIDALTALARTGDDRAIPRVVKALQSSDFTFADSATRAVRYLGPAVLQALSPLLQSPHEDVVARALSALGTVRTAGSVPLVRPFASDRRSKIRAAAAKALGGCRCKSGLEVLSQLVSDPHAAVRQTVARSLTAYPLSSTSDVLARLLRDREYWVANTALETVAEKPAGARILASYLGDREAPLGDEAIAAMAKTRSAAALGVMVEALRRGEARFRQALRDGIAAYGKRGINRLLEAAIDERGLRSDAYAVLSAHPELSVPLMSAAVDRSPATTPTFVIRALGTAKGKLALDALERAWASNAPSVRMDVIKALSGFPAAAVKNRLTAAAASTDPIMRAAAARSAARAGIREIIPALTAALADQSLPIDVALDGLARLKSTAGESYMVAHFKNTGTRMKVRLAILHACKRLQTPACIKILYGATNDLDSSIRFEALKLLAQR